VWTPGGLSLDASMSTASGYLRGGARPRPRARQARCIASGASAAPFFSAMLQEGSPGRGLMRYTDSTTGARPDEPAVAPSWDENLSKDGHAALALPRSLVRRPDVARNLTLCSRQDGWVTPVVIRRNRAVGSSRVRGGRLVPFVPAREGSYSASSLRRPRILMQTVEGEG